MSTCIKAYHRQEERYCGLNLEFTVPSDKDKIVKNVAELKAELKLDPDVFENNKPDGTGGVYIEFLDDYDKESGIFFEALIKRLDIKECEV